jgi:hypothetical protein
MLAILTLEPTEERAVMVQKSLRDIISLLNTDRRYIMILSLKKAYQVYSNSLPGEKQIPVTTNILQPKDSAIKSVFPYTYGEETFSSRSVHIYNVQQLLDREGYAFL